MYKILKTPSELIGKTLMTATLEKSTSRYGDCILFVSTSGERYVMYHSQECCECVYVEDVDNDLDVLVGSPLTLAEESSNEDLANEYDEVELWTFYRFATAKGFVTIRWYGSTHSDYALKVEIRQIE